MNRKFLLLQLVTISRHVSFPFDTSCCTFFIESIFLSVCTESSTDLAYAHRAFVACSVFTIVSLERKIMRKITHYLVFAKTIYQLFHADLAHHWHVLPAY